MESTVKELQEKIEKYKIREKRMSLFFKEYNINDFEDLISIIIEHDTNILENSDIFNALKDAEHDLIVRKFDHLSIRRSIYKYNKIKKNSTKKIKEIKEYNLFDTYNNFNDILSEIENEFNEWCKVPKCVHCDIVFDNYNHSYSVRKYDLYDLCLTCINNELKTIVSKQKFIKEIDEKYKNNKVVNKLLSTNYHNLTLYNEIYIDSQKEQISLYNEDIIRYAGFDPNNEWDIYKLNNLCYRANKLIELYDDKIRLINIPESDLARMGKMEFQAICDVLYEKVGGYAGCENIIKALNMNNNEEMDINSDIESDHEDDYIPEPPDEEYESDENDDAMKFGSSILLRQSIKINTCIKCGAEDIIPGNNTCITCKFSSKPQK